MVSKTNCTEYKEILETIVNNSLIPQMIINEDGTFRLCNQAGKFLFKKLWDIKFNHSTLNWKSLNFDNSFSVSFVKDIETAFTGQIIVDQYRIKTNHNNSEEYYYEFQFFPVFKADNIITNVCINAIDITNLKYKESLLLDSITINQSVFSSLDEPYLQLNNDLSFYNANTLFFQYFNTNRENVIDLFINEFIWENKDISLEYIKNFKLNNELLTFYNQTKNEKLFFKVSSDTIRLNEKQIIFLLFKDITNLKKELKHSQMLLTSIEKSSLGFMFFDAEYRLSYINANIKDLFNFPIEQYIHKTIDSIYNDNKSNECFLIVYQKIKDKLNWKGKIKCISKDNQQEILDTGVYCFYGDDKQIEQYMVIFRNATHEVHLEKHLHQAQKLEALGTLAGGIAHDFNNILSAMLGFTELSIMDLDEDCPQYFNLQQIQISANRAKDMINQILTFSRKTDMQLKPLIINPIIKEAIKLLRASFPAYVEIIHNLPPEPLKIMGDPTQINQIVMNLGTNAMQSLQNKIGKILISLSLETINSDNKSNKLVLNEGKYVLLKISDTGCGIPEHIKSKVFDPYFTTKTSETGTGLGLAVVHGIVSALNGFIHFDSEPNKGTNFYIYLPYYDNQELPIDKSVEALKSGKGQKILFLDDESPIVNVNCQILKKLNYIAYGFTDTLKAFDFYVENYFEIDLIITDMTMPEITGLEFINMIRELNPIIPIIICSGYSELLDNNKNEDNYLYTVSKPISTNQMAHLINEIFNESL